MWTSQETSQSQSRWSEFPITTQLESVTLSFKAELRTRQLSLNILPEGQEERHEVIHSLYVSGLNDRQIADQQRFSKKRCHSHCLSFFNEYTFIRLYL